MLTFAAHTALRVVLRPHLPSWRGAIDGARKADGAVDLLGDLEAVVEMLIAKNRSAAVLWSAGAAWSFLVVAMSGVAVREGALSTLEWGALLVFWAAAAGLVAYVSGKPCHSATLEPNGDVVFIWLHPHKRVRKVFPASALADPYIDTFVDDDGDNHFTARIRLPDGDAFILSQSIVVGGGPASDGMYRERCRLACERFSAGVAEGRRKSV